MYVVTVFEKVVPTYVSGTFESEFDAHVHAITLLEDYYPGNWTLGNCSFNDPRFKKDENNQEMLALALQYLDQCRSGKKDYPVYFSRKNLVGEHAIASVRETQIHKAGCKESTFSKMLESVAEQLAEDEPPFPLGDVS
jgi:hypothetical protein